MRLQPSSPELLPIPPGQTSRADRMRSQVELSVEAHRNTTRAVYSVETPLTASMARTPVARLRSRSYTTSVTIANVFNVSRPVAIAGGKVDDCVLKYAP